MKNETNVEKVIQFIVDALEGDFAIKMATVVKKVAEDDVLIDLIDEWFDQEHADELEMKWIIEDVSKHGLKHFNNDIEKAATVFDETAVRDGFQKGLEFAIRAVVEAKYL